jgi:hypothetical protein
VILQKLAQQVPARDLKTISDYGWVKPDDSSPWRNPASASNCSLDAANAVAAVEAAVAPPTVWPERYACSSVAVCARVRG